MKLRAVTVGEERQRVNKKKLRRQRKRASHSKTSDFNNNKQRTDDCDEASTSAASRAQNDASQVNSAVFVCQMLTIVEVFML